MLFFVLTPAYGQLLSDTTGLINRLEIQTSGHTFEIKLTSNFDLNNFTFNEKQKQLTLNLESNLENNLSEIIIPKNLLSGDFTFFLNDQEIFPNIQSNEIISFITLEFSGSGTHIVKIIATEYLNGLSEIVPIKNEVPILTEISTNQIPSNDYTIWFIAGGILVTIMVFVGIKILKNKN